MDIIKLLTILFVFCSIFSSCENSKDSITITVGGVKFQVETADTPEERENGLMFRKKLEKNTGMLFIFKEDKKLSFWMKNTYIPLSIAYISKDGIIKEIYNMEPESVKPIKSIHSVRYALELNLGAFNSVGAKPGDIVVFPKGMSD